MATTNGIVVFDGSKIVTPSAAGISGILGVADASSSSSGQVGEIVTANVPATGGSPVTLTTATFVDICNITLSAGDWQIYGLIGFTGAVTGTQYGAFYATASGNVSTGIDLSKNTTETVLSPTTNDLILTMPTYRVNNNGSITYYLKAFATFTVGTLKAYGTIEARRMR